MNIAFFIQGIMHRLGERYESEKMAKTTRTELGISRQNEWHSTA